MNIKRTFVENGPQGGNIDETIDLLKKIRPSDKTTDVLLIEARCHEMKGNHKSALSAAGRLISKVNIFYFLSFPFFTCRDIQ